MDVCICNQDFIPWIPVKTNANLTRFQFLVDAALIFPSFTLQEEEHEAFPLTFTDMEEEVLTLSAAMVQ